MLKAWLRALDTAGDAAATGGVADAAAEANLRLHELALPAARLGGAQWAATTMKPCAPRCLPLPLTRQRIGVRLCIFITAELPLPPRVRLSGPAQCSAVAAPAAARRHTNRLLEAPTRNARNSKISTKSVPFQSNHVAAKKWEHMSLAECHLRCKMPTI